MLLLYYLLFFVPNVSYDILFRLSVRTGPPLDIWSLGVILFSILCGRLPFEGNDTSGSKKPRDTIIRSKIVKCQYKIDDHLSSDAKVSVSHLTYKLKY